MSTTVYVSQPATVQVILSEHAPPQVITYREGEAAAAAEALRDETQELRNQTEGFKDAAALAEAGATAAATTVVDERAYPLEQVTSGLDTVIETGTQVLGTLTGTSNSGNSRTYIIGKKTKDGYSGTITFETIGTSAYRVIALVENENGNLDYHSEAALPAGAVGVRTAVPFTFPEIIEDEAWLGIYVDAVTASKIKVSTANGFYISGEPTAIVNQPITSLGGGLAKAQITWNFRQVRGKREIANRLEAVEGSAVPLDGIYMGSSSNSSFGRTALLATVAGLALTLAIFVGDSNTAGSHTGTNGTPADAVTIPANGTLGYTDAFNRSWVAKAAGQLPKPLPEGPVLPIFFEGFHGRNNPQGTYLAYNQRVSAEGDWINQGSPTYTTLGGAVWESTSAGDGSPLIWTPTRPFDTLVHAAYATTAAPAQTVQIDALTPDVINLTATANEYRQTVIPVTLGAHTVKVARSGTVTTRFAGMMAYDSTEPAVRIVPMGFPGSTAATSHAGVVGSQWSPGNLIGTFPAPIKFQMLGTNDIDDGVTLANYLAGQRTLITKMMVGATAVVFGPPPQYDDGLNTTKLRQRQFRFGLKALCAELGAIFVDTYAIFGDYETAVARGLMDDGLHLSPAGAALLGQYAAYVFMRLLG